MPSKFDSAVLIPPVLENSDGFVKLQLSEFAWKEGAAHIHTYTAIINDASTEEPIVCQTFLTLTLPPPL